MKHLQSEADKVGAVLVKFCVVVKLFKCFNVLVSCITIVRGGGGKARQRESNTKSVQGHMPLTDKKSWINGQVNTETRKLLGELRAGQHKEDDKIT